MGIAVLFRPGDGSITGIIMVSGLLLFYGTFWWLSRVIRGRRTAAIRRVAARHGWRFETDADYLLPSTYEAFKLFEEGDSRCARNLIRFSAGGLSLEVFDYQYTTGFGRNAEHHLTSLCIARLPRAFPHSLSIRPEDIGDVLTAAVGFNDIDFESDEFSRMFHVSGPDRKFAYALIDQRMMVWMLAVPSLRIELRETLLMVRIGDDVVPPEELVFLPALALGFWAQVPGHVKEEMKQS